MLKRIGLKLQLMFQWQYFCDLFKPEILKFQKNSMIFRKVSFSALASLSKIFRVPIFEILKKSYNMTPIHLNFLQNSDYKYNVENTEEMLLFKSIMELSFFKAIP